MKEGLSQPTGYLAGWLKGWEKVSFKRHNRVDISRIKKELARGDRAQMFKGLIQNESRLAGLV